MRKRKHTHILTLILIDTHSHLQKHTRMLVPPGLCDYANMYKNAFLALLRIMWLLAHNA